LLAFQSQAATAQETKPTCAVYGDSRSMMNLPYKSDQEADARQLMVDMYLVLPEKVSEEVIKKAKKGTSKTRADHCY
jgi:hypothetical protein